MAGVTIRHVFTSPVPDATITSIVRPSNWNSVHAVSIDGFLTTAMASDAGSNFVQATAGFNGTNASGTIASNAISVSVGNYITTAMASNRGSDFVQATAAFAGTSASGTIASNGISVSVGPYITTAMASNRASDFVAATAAFAGTSASGTINSTGISVSVGPYITTAMASNRASDFVQATAVFHGTNATGTIASGAISVSVAPPSAAAESNAINLLGANTAGNTTATGSTLGFSGINVTLSGTNNSQIVWSVGNYITTARASTDAIGLNTAGTNITWTANSSGLSIDAGGYAGTGFTSTTTAGTQVKATNNTAGLSMAVPVFLTTAAAAATAISGIIASDATYTSGSVYFSNQNNITIGSSVDGASQYVRLSVGNYLTTAMASNRGSDFVQATAAFAGTSASGTIASNGISVSVGPYITTAALSNHSHGVSFTSGSTVFQTLSFTNSNGISFNSGTQGIFASHNAITTARASTDAIGLNTAQTNVTWTVNSSGLSLNAGGYAGTNTAMTGGSVTLNTSGISINLPAYLTTADLSANSSKYVQNWKLTGNTAGTTSSAQGTDLWFSGGNSITVSGNSNTVVFSVGNYLTTAMASNRGSDFVQATAAFAGTNASGTIASGGISVSVAAPGAAVEVNPFNLLGANTAGNTTATGSTIGLSGLNLTLSGTNNSQIVMSAPATSSLVATNGVSISSAGSTITISGVPQNIKFYEPYTQTNTAGLALGAGTWYFAPFVVPGTMSGGRFNFLMLNTSTAGIARDWTATAYASNTGSTGTKQQSYTFSMGMALFSQGTGTNSTRLESFYSNNFSFGISGRLINSVTGGNNSLSVANSWSISYIQDIGSDGAYTLSQFASNGSTNYTNTSMDRTVLESVGLSLRNMLSNSILMPIGLATTLTPGNYWLGLAWSSTTASAVTQFAGTAGASALMFSHLSMIGISRLELNSAFRNWGSTATTARSQIFLGAGAMYTGAANMAPPANIAISSDLSSLASQWIPYFNYQYRGLTK